MPTCSFCRKSYKEPRGLTVFTFDGRSLHYCSSKCRKNMEHLKRDPKKTNWVRRSPDFYLASEAIEESNNKKPVETEEEK